MGLKVDTDGRTNRGLYVERMSDVEEMSAECRNRSDAMTKCDSKPAVSAIHYVQLCAQDHRCGSML